MTELACGMQDSLVCFRRLKKKNVLAIYCNRNYVALVAFYYNGLHAQTGFRITGYLDLGKLNSSSLAPPFRTQEYLLLCSEAKLNYSVVLAENLSYPLVLRSHKLDYQTISLMVLPKLTRKGFRWAPDQWASPLTMRGVELILWIQLFQIVKLVNHFLVTLSRHQ